MLDKLYFNKKILISIIKTHNSIHSLTVYTHSNIDKYQTENDHERIAISIHHPKRISDNYKHTDNTKSNETYPKRKHLMDDYVKVPRRRMRARKRVHKPDIAGEAQPAHPHRGSGPVRSPRFKLERASTHQTIERPFREESVSLRKTF